MCRCQAVGGRDGGMLPDVVHASITIHGGREVGVLASDQRNRHCNLLTEKQLPIVLTDVVSRAPREGQRIMHSLMSAGIGW